MFGRLPLTSGNLAGAGCQSPGLTGQDCCAEERHAYSPAPCGSPSVKTACPLEVPQPVQASPGTLRTAREAASAADLWPVNPWEAVCPSDSPGIGLAPNFPPLPTLHPQGPPFLSPPKGNWHFLPLSPEGFLETSVFPPTPHTHRELLT